VAVKVRLVGDLTRFVGPEPIELEGAGCTLGAAFDELTRRFPRLGRELFDDRGRLHYAVVLVIGGRTAIWPRDKDSPIEDGGEFLLTRFHSGG
jgi:molybdopterin converting factor small subunit